MEPSFDTKEFEKIIDRVHPVWAKALKSLIDLPESYDRYVTDENSRKFEYFVIVVPCRKAADHLLAKTRYTPKVMDGDNLWSGSRPEVILCTVSWDVQLVSC
jgi:hypothetical protein